MLVLYSVGRKDVEGEGRGVYCVLYTGRQFAMSSEQSFVSETERYSPE